MPNALFLFGPKISLNNVQVISSEVLGGKSVSKSLFGKPHLFSNTFTSRA